MSVLVVLARHALADRVAGRDRAGRRGREPQAAIRPSEGVGVAGPAAAAAKSLE